MKTTAVVESLSKIQPDVLFQRLPAYFKIECSDLSDVDSFYKGIKCNKTKTGQVALLQEN